jgi:hypothetical protein
LAGVRRTRLRRGCSASNFRHVTFVPYPRRYTHPVATRLPTLTGDVALTGHRRYGRGYGI